MVQPSFGILNWLGLLLLVSSLAFTARTQEVGHDCISSPAESVSSTISIPTTTESSDSERSVANRKGPYREFWTIWGGASFAAIANGSLELVPTAAAFSSTNNATFRLLSDNATVSSFTVSILNQCEPLLANGSGIVIPCNTGNFSAGSTQGPTPEQIIQSYHAGSVILTLDGYNNSAVGGVGVTPGSLLHLGIDMALLDCLNMTILGDNFPAASGVSSVQGDGAAGRRDGAPISMLMALVWVWMFLPDA